MSKHPFVFSFQEGFILMMRVTWVQAVKNVQMVLLLRLIKHREQILQIASLAPLVKIYGQIKHKHK